MACRGARRRRGSPSGGAHLAPGRRQWAAAATATGALAAVLLACGTARAQAPRAGAAASGGSWLQGNRIRLTVSPGGAATPQTGAITYTFSIAADGDMRIAIDEQTPRGNSGTEILLISGRFMASRGSKLEKGYEIDTVDAAALSWQIAGQILGRASPGDPVRLRAPVRVALAENRVPIHVVTSSAEETFDPPWSAQGRINPIGDSRVDFEIVFAFRNPMPPSGAMEMRYAGRWERSPIPPALADATRLEGWTVYALGAQRRRDKDGVAVDFGASPLPQRFATVGDLRRSLADGKR